MNKQRREKIRELRDQIDICKEKLQIILDEEQYYFDNMPENLQGSLRGADSENAIDIMEGCIEGLDNVIEELIGI